MRVGIAGQRTKIEGQKRGQIFQKAEEGAFKLILRSGGANVQ